MRQHGADLDHEHHRVLPLDVGPQHDERLLQGGAEQFRSEQALAAAGPASVFQFCRSSGGAGSVSSVVMGLGVFENVGLRVGLSFGGITPPPGLLRG